MNICIFAGNLGADPELRSTGNGTSILKLRLAVNERRKNKNDEWEDHVEWVPVVVWGKRGEGLAKILEKGTGVVVRGTFRTRSYDDKDGNKRYMTEVVADDVRPMGGRNNGSKPQQSSGGKQQSKTQPPKAQQEFPDTDDDIPFD